MAMRSNIDEFAPPNNLDAEMCALGSMMLSERAAEDVLGILSADDFYSPAHQEIFRAINQLILSSRAVDLVTVKNELDDRKSLPAVGGTDYLIQVAESVPSPANAGHYANIVLDKATSRRLIDAGQHIVKLAHDGERDSEEKVDAAEALVFEVGRRRIGKEMVPIWSLAKDFFVVVDDLVSSGQPVVGLQSGFYDLDRMTRGFYGGDLSILAARPSMGKTSLVLSFALNIARKNEGNVAVFSLEMSGKQLVRRLLSMISGVSMNVLTKPKLSDDDYHALADACEALYNLPIFIDDSSDVSPMDIRGKCRRLRSEGGLALIVVDYLQLMRGGRRTENRVQEISDIARGLKAISKEFDVPVIALSQLNRGVEAREDKRPLLSDIRESGSIEAEADLVMFIYRDAYYKAKEAGADAPQDANRVEEAEIIIAKHRNGPTGKVFLGFQPSYARFRNLQKSD